ncbi:hypothetical protein KC19_9G154700 [Ceratodon purpureus]|uniref:Uncharacterized protein n=1 Tax=Ceratodon purpureus TaxID=3225 RepID=A0A8T0GU52_CERPU|nr:hypothetical protein KC19_9G154700 [Ceratodon purpureus]
MTARNFDLLPEKMETFICSDDCIEMPELEESEARSLLLYHAAPSNHVNEDVLRQCLQRCYFRKDDDGDDYDFLPMALEELGLQSGNDADQWTEELDTHIQVQEKEHSIYSVMRKRFDEHPIFSILKKSFDALSKEDQILFMDAALFYPRDSFVDPSWNISTLDWMHMVHGGNVEDIKARLKGLRDKSLLQSFDEFNPKIGIHVFWREFAVIEANAGKQSPWIYDNHEDDQINRHRGESNILHGSGWEDLQRAFIWRSRVKEDLNFSLCSNLTALTLRNVPLVNKTLDLSPLKCLKYLEVHFHGGYGSAQVLGLGSLRSLVVLRWFYVLAISPCLREIGLLINLQVLQLHFLHWKKRDSSRLNFQHLDFSRLSLLRTFSLSATGDEYLTPYVGWFHQVVTSTRYKFEMLERYRVTDVYMIESLRNFQKLQSLQKLDISRCACIKALPGLNELVALLELKATRCIYLEEFPSLHKLQRLQKLDISFCVSIRTLPGLDDLVALLEFDAHGCFELAELPNFQKLQKLQRLDISVCSKIKAVPGLNDLVSLLELRVGGCTNLEELPNIQKLQQLQKLDISECPSIKALPGLGDLVALQELRAQNCFNLTELPDLRKLTSLRVLDLKTECCFEEYRVKYPEYFPEEHYEEFYSAAIKPVSIKSMPGLDELTALSILTVDFVVFEDVPDLRKLTNLTKLSVRGWSSRAGAGIAFLPNLQILRISYTDGLQLVEPTGISSFTSLRRLELHRCDFEDVSCLSSLNAFQHLQVSYYGDSRDGYLCLRKLLLSVLDLPSDTVRFTLYVDYDLHSWEFIRDELQRLQDRSLLIAW